MTSYAPHRNVTKKYFCPGCYHFHVLPNSNVPGAVGVCLYQPPETFIVGMVPVSPAVMVDPAQATQMVPVIRAYYPPVGPQDTCSQWTPRIEGEA
jgi:hypothetical protein